MDRATSWVLAWLWFSIAMGFLWLGVADTGFAHEPPLWVRASFCVPFAVLLVIAAVSIIRES